MGPYEGTVERLILRPAGPAPFCEAQDMIDFLGCKHTLTAHFSSSSFPSPSLQGFFQSFHYPVYLDIVLPWPRDRTSDLAFWTSLGSCGYTFPKLIQAPSDGILSHYFINFTIHPNVICKFDEGALHHTKRITVSIKILSTICPSMVPWGILVTGFHLDILPLIDIFKSSQFLFHLIIQQSKQYICSLNVRMFWENYIKDLQKSKQMSSVFPHLSTGELLQRRPLD